MHLAMQDIISGLLEGGVIALLAVSLSVVFGVMKIVNFAQADFMVVGMYGAYTIASRFHVPAAALGFIVFLPAVLLGVLVYVGIVSRGASRGESLGGFSHSQLLLTFALSIVIEALLQAIYGAAPVTLPGASTYSTWRIGGYAIDVPRLEAFVISLIVSVLLLAFLRFTQTGRQIRATASDETAAQLVGISVARVKQIVFGISIGLAALAGGVLIGFYPASPSTGSDFIFLMFAAIALGGLGNVLGALVGGLLIGLAQGVAEVALPLELNSVAVFAIFLAVIFLRPNGIFGVSARL
jgi:branched-chain amino acid transport system permease protein